jgi:hypothetical protein
MGAPRGRDVAETLGPLADKPHQYLGRVRDTTGSAAWGLDRQPDGLKMFPHLGRFF